jgi:Kef-type K+ transport system membrane component KefB
MKPFPGDGPSTGWSADGRRGSLAAEPEELHPVNIYYVAFVWVAMALAASVISVRLGVSVALVEILVGAVVGNLPHAPHYVQQTQFTTFLASLGSVMLTFLAGAEIDPVSLRKHWRASLSIGFVSFVLPFVGAFAFCFWALGWTLHAAEIGGIALSTTSVAVVYAVMIESGLNRQELGKLILAACFVTDLGTVLALGGLFANFGRLLVVFVLVSACSLALLPSAIRFVIHTFGHRVSEPEIKFLLVVLLGLGALATKAGSEAVLPAYVAGLVVAGVFLHDRILIDRLRSISFALLTPFFFLRAGVLISASALASGAGVIALLLLVKLVAKGVGVWPIASAFGVPRRERTYLTLLMATGLTFGSIAALFGLTHGLISQRQYSELVTVVLLSAFVPTLIAQQLFQPEVVDQEEEEALGAEDVATIRHRPAAHEGPRADGSGDSQGHPAGDRDVDPSAAGPKRDPDE